MKEDEIEKMARQKVVTEYKGSLEQFAVDNWKAGYAAATHPPTPECEINKYWTDLLEAEAEHHASNYHNIEDFKKIYDAVLHGCKFGFEERQREIDLLEKAHEITIQQLVETQKERNKWKEQCETPTPVKEEGITVGQLLKKSFDLHELNPDVVGETLQFPKGVITKLINDDFYTNSVPVVLFKNLLPSLHIPFTKIEPAMIPPNLF